MGAMGRVTWSPIYSPIVETSLESRKQRIWKGNFPVLEPQSRYVLLYDVWFKPGIAIFQHLLFVKNYSKMAYIKGMESSPWFWTSFPLNFCISESYMVDRTESRNPPCVLRLHLSLTTWIQSWPGGSVKVVLELSKTFVKAGLCLWDLFSCYHGTEDKDHEQW